MKLERVEKKFVFGVGAVIYKSELFRVCQMNYRGDKRTIIESEIFPDKEINFDGYHNLNSDALCLEQLSTDEIVEMFAEQKRQALIEGGKAKIKKIIANLELEQ